MLLNQQIIIYVSIMIYLKAGYAFAMSTSTNGANFECCAIIAYLIFLACSAIKSSFNLPVAKFSAVCGNKIFFIALCCVVAISLLFLSWLTVSGFDERLYSKISMYNFGRMFNNNPYANDNILAFVFVTLLPLIIYCLYLYKLEKKTSGV